MELIIYTDGASRGNPGPSSYGFIIANEEGKLLYEEGGYIGITTNNVAEYTAVLKALEKVLEKFKIKQRLKINLFADSKLIAEQLSGRYRIKSLHLKPLAERIKKLLVNFEQVIFTHIPRSKNTLADRLANQALDSHSF